MNNNKNKFYFVKKQIQFSMNLIFLTLLMYSLQPVNSNAQVMQWVRRYNGSGNMTDHSDGIVTDSSGNVYVLGNVWTSSHDHDIITRKYSASGTLVWQDMFTLSGIDYSKALTIDQFGNVYALGYSASSNGNCICIIKYNSSGIRQWVQSSATLLNSAIASDIIVDPAGNVYVLGSGYYHITSFNILTLKYNSSGILQWIAVFGSGAMGNENGKKIALDKTGNIIVAGYTTNRSGNEDYITVKYNSSGVIQWSKKYNGPGNGNDVINDAAIDTSGNIIVTGSSYGGSTDRDFATVMYNSSGVMQWVQRYNSPANGIDQAYAMVLDNSGNSYVTGMSSGNGNQTDIATIKYDNLGNQIWVSRYNGSANSDDVGNCITIDAQSNIYIGGYSVFAGTDVDFLTIKYDNAGIMQWQALYNGPVNGDDYIGNITVDHSGNVFVVGNSEGIGSSFDIATIKYSQNGNSKPVQIETPLEFSTKSYPNPFNPTTNIELTLPGNYFVNLTIYDISGKKVETLVNKEMIAGSQNFTWDASDYSAGVYFYKITAASGNSTFTKTMKLLLVK